MFFLPVIFYFGQVTRQYLRFLKVLFSMMCFLRFCFAGFVRRLSSINKPQNRRLMFKCNLTIQTEGGRKMSSVYKVIEVIGGSEKSWEDAAKKAVELTAKSLKEIRIAEVKELDMRIEEGKVVEYRVKLRVSFKYLPD